MTDLQAPPALTGEVVEAVHPDPLIPTGPEHAKIAMADKSIVHLWADNGHYNMKTDMLDLTDNIHLVSSTGYEARLSKATVDVRKGNVVSDTPVWVKLLDGNLNAKHLEIVDKGDTLRFTDVTLVLQSGKQATKAGRP